MNDTNNIVWRAKQFAIKPHGEQKYGERPYSDHLDAVAAITAAELAKKPFYYYNKEAIHAAAYLHDVIEDTVVTYEQIAAEFGFVVADIVYAVSDEPGANRKERKARTYPKIRAGGMVPTMIKLADRIANVEFCLSNKSSLFGMYFKEHMQFFNAIHVGGELEDMWARLELLFELPNE